MPNLAHFLRATTVGNVPVALACRTRRRCVRARGRARVDAPIRPRSRHCDVRRPRDHAQRAAVLREDRAGTEHVLLRPRDDRPAPGVDRRPDRDLHRVRLSAEPLRAHAASDARRLAGRLGGRHLRLSSAPRSLCPVRRARGTRRRPLRAPAADEHRFALPRPHVHHAGDARRRWRVEPLGRGHRRARRQRARLLPRAGGERRQDSRRHHRPAGGNASRRRRGARWRSC